MIDRDYEVWEEEINVPTCVNCKQYYIAMEYGTDCPILNIYDCPLYVTEGIDDDNRVN